MDMTFEDLIKGFGRTKKRAVVKSNSKSLAYQEQKGSGGVKANTKSCGDQEQKGSRVSNVTVMKPATCREDVHGINSLIVKMIDVEEEPPVVQVRSVVRMAATKVSERHYSDSSFDDEPIEPFKPPHKPKVATSITKTKLTVDNLALTVDQEDFEELFEEFIGVLKVVVNTDTKGLSLGTGYALFSSRAEALKAVDKYNNVPLDNKPMKMSVKRLEKPPPQPVIKVPKHQSVFNRLTREPLIKSTNQMENTNKLSNRLTRETHIKSTHQAEDTNKLNQSPSVFSRLSRGPIGTSALKTLRKLDHIYDVSSRKRFRYSPEPGSIDDSGDDSSAYHEQPRKTLTKLGHIYNVSSKKRFGYSPESGSSDDDSSAYQDHRDRLTREPHIESINQTQDTNKLNQSQSVFSRLSKGPVGTSALKTLKKLDHIYNVPSKKRSMYYPEPGSIDDIDEDRPRKPIMERQVLEQKTSKRRHYLEYSPDIVGRPERNTYRYIDYDNPEHQERQAEENFHTYKLRQDYDNTENYGPPRSSVPRYIDYDNPEYQERPSHIVRHQKRKVVIRDRPEGSLLNRKNIHGVDDVRRRGGPRLTTEELDAELEEMVNPKIDTDVFGH